MPDTSISNSVMLPYSLEAEQAVLGSVLTDPDCMEIIISKVKPEYFYLPQHQIVFSSMLTMYTGSKAKIDPVVIADVLVKEGLYDLAGGRDYLLTLRDNVPSTANVETYAKIVEEQYYLRALITVSQGIIEKATSGAVEAVQLLNSA
ncbi:MAG: replicative DNA helicase, partial [Eubacterium sp.]